MKFKPLLFALGVAVLISGIVAYQESNVSEALAPVAQKPSVASSSRADPLVAGRSPSAFPAIQNIPLSISAKGIGELRAKLAQGKFARGEQAYFLTQAANLCESAQVSPRHSNSESAKTLEDFAAQFCKDFAGSPGLEIAKLNELPQGDPVVDAFGTAAALYEMAADSPPDKRALGAATYMLDKQMLSKTAGVDGLIAAEALHQVGYVSPKVENLASTAGWQLGRGDLSKAQVLAAQMQVCGRYGACGAGQLMTMHFCGSLGVCRAGVTSQQVWQRSYSPSVYLAAQEINRLGRI